MPSHAYRHWTTVRAAERDEVEAAHALVGGTRRGRRYATQQINRAYGVLLASQFQGFCRDLHTEVVDYLVAVIPPIGIRMAMQQELLWNRQLKGGPRRRTVAGTPSEAANRPFLRDLAGWQAAPLADDVTI